jgi:hypothetical protein
MRHRDLSDRSTGFAIDSLLLYQTRVRLPRLTEILHHSQQAMFQAFRSSHSPAGRGGAMDETPKLGLITIGARSEVTELSWKMGNTRIQQ